MKEKIRSDPIVYRTMPITYNVMAHNMTCYYLTLGPCFIKVIVATMGSTTVKLQAITLSSPRLPDINLYFFMHSVH